MNDTRIVESLSRESHVHLDERSWLHNSFGPERPPSGMQDPDGT